jgi:tetratricopeptide (TPR) repeat protein
MRRLQFIPFAAWIAFQVAPLAAQDLNPSQVFEKVKASVLVVKSLNASGKAIAQGSGVKLPSGRIITNFHVVKEGATFRVGQGSHFVHATIYAADAEKDLCLLDTPGLSAPAIVVGHAATLKIGAKVYAVGSPEGLELSLSDGLVSQLRGANPPIIQTTAAISPGSSGGGLFDAQGRLVGITSFYLEGGQNLNFALPVEWVATLKQGLRPNVSIRPTGDWLAQAARLEAAKDWLSLKALAQAWLQADPKDDAPWAVLGEADGWLGQPLDAIDAYRQALKLNPNDNITWYNLGNVYMGLQRYSDALEAYRQALKLNSNEGKAWYNLGNAYRHLQRYSDALEAYHQALKLNPNDNLTWNNIGNTYNDIQGYSDALEAYRQSLKLNSNDNLTWYNLGNTYRHLERNADAIEAYRQALKLNPDNEYAWGNLGSTYLLMQNFQKSIEACKQALKLNPDDVMSWANLAYAQALSDDNAAALKSVQQLRRLDPNKADKLFDLIVPK